MLKWILREVLFWTHVCMMLAALFVSLLLPFWTFAFLALAHRAHMVIFRGCAFSLLQKKLDCMPQEQTFIQHMMERFLQRPFNRMQADAVDMCILFGSLGIAFGRQIML